MKNKKLNRYAVGAAVVFFIGTLFPYAYGAADRSLKKLRTLVEVMEFVKENYVEAVDSDKLAEGALRGVVGELDDFSQYLNEKDFKNLKNDTRGDFGGLGIRLQKKDDFITVITPMPDTPAFKAGIMPGDRILFVDDKDLNGMELEEAVELMRGPVGSKVKITISRNNEKAGKYERLPDYHFKREKIVPEVVYHRMLSGDVGYLYMVDFSGHSLEEIEKALTDLTKKGMKKLVLDLRFNPGGLLAGAVDISKLFLPKDKMIVYTQGRKPMYYQEFKTQADGSYTLPMAVLVNQGSASASEIVSGALQDNKRAFIVGQRTFGKASVQQVIPLAGGTGLRLTIARYYTPSGRLIQRDYKDKSKAEEGGIFPDVEVIVKANDEYKVFKPYSDIVYIPGKPAPKLEFTAPDPVLDKAVEILSGKISLEDAIAASQKAIEERKAKKSETAQEEEIVVSEPEKADK